MSNGNEWREKDCVEIPEDVYFYASGRGAERHAEALRAKKEDVIDTPDPLKIHILGALAEAAFRIHQGKEVIGHLTINDYAGADYGKNTEVRGTDYKGGCLIIRPRDVANGKIKRDWVLCIALDSSYRKWIVIGGIRGEENMLKEKYKRNPGGRGMAWFIPQEAFKHIEPKQLIPS